MTKEEAIRYFKTQQGLAEALGIHQSSVSLWEEYPPDRRQLQIQNLTHGKLKAEPGCEERFLSVPDRKSRKTAKAS